MTTLVEAAEELARRAREACADCAAAQKRGSDYLCQRHADALNASYEERRRRLDLNGEAEAGLRNSEPSPSVDWLDRARSPLDEEA